MAASGAGEGEASSAVTPRDAAALNLLMLLAPIDAVRDWQAG